MQDRPTVYVVVLNWKGASDTIACLSSVFASRDACFRVVVCDNQSGDDSLGRISRWAEGEEQIDKPGNPRLAGLCREAAAPIEYLRLSRQEAEQVTPAALPPLVLIDNGANLGFAAGNNVGLRFALNQPDMDFVWLLNNDTLVEPDCLSRMLARVADAPGQAVCGSMIHFFDRPEVIQAIGGNRFNTFTGIAACSEGRYLNEQSCFDVEETAARLDYISGCSLLAPRHFLEQVGLMSEDYFLYYEEIDWFTRAAGRFEIRVAEGARVYHREGSSIGSPNMERASSALSDFHMFRSRLLFMRKHYRRFLPVCYVVTAIAAFRRAVAGRFINAKVVLAAMVGRRVFAG